MYDFFKGISLEFAKFYKIKRHCFQHGSDYGYQKNFISHFLKDYNNCEIFYSYFFDKKVLVNNNIKLKKLIFNIPKIITLKHENFYYIWSLLTPKFNFFKKNYVLYVGTVFTSYFEQELFDQRKIFNFEIDILKKLNKKKIIIYKLNKKYSKEYVIYLKKRFKNIIFTNFSLRSLVPFIKNIKIYSVNFSTGHMEFLTFQKKIKFVDPKKVFDREIDSQLIKKFL